MIPTINPQNGIPIFEQVSRYVTFAIANRVYHTGDLLPSVRDMAQELAVNPNTVSRAYGELQREGIIASLRGTGMQVTPDAPQLCLKVRKRLIQERLSQALQEARSSQIPRDDVSKFIDRELARLWKEEAS